VRIADALAHQGADILVLSEYRGGEAAVRLRATLETLGYRHVTVLAPPPGRSGVLIAARCAFRDHGEVDGGLPEPYRMVGVEFPGFRLVGVYMPNLLAKVPYWETLIATLGETPGRHALAVGDSTPAVPTSTRRAPSTGPRTTWTKWPRSGSVICGATVIRKFGNIPGSAPGETASASTTPFCRMR
jgi:hypothetical protein